MLTWPPAAPVDATGDAAATGEAAPTTGEAAPAAGAAALAADGAPVAGAAADAACGAVVGFGPVVAVGVVDPPHAASTAPATDALAARNRRRVQMACRSLVVIGMTSPP